MIVLLAIAVVVLVVVLVLRAVDSGLEPESPLSPEEQQRAALELYAIGRRLDVVLLRHQARVDASRLRRELDQELADEAANRGGEDR